MRALLLALGLLACGGRPQAPECSPDPAGGIRLEAPPGETCLELGTPSARKIAVATLRNDGPEPETVTLAVDDARFRLRRFQLHLEPCESGDVEVLFVPKDASAVEATLSATSSSATVSLCMRVTGGE